MDIHRQWAFFTDHIYWPGSSSAKQLEMQHQLVIPVARIPQHLQHWRPWEKLWQQQTAAAAAVSKNGGNFRSHERKRALVH